MNGAVIIMAQIRKVIRRFREANATTPATSILPAEYGIRHSMIFKKLVRDGVLVQINEQRYYLDEEREAVVRKQRQARVLIMVVILVVALIVGLLISK